MPFDLRSAAMGMVLGVVSLMLLGGSSLAQTLCHPNPVDKSEKNKIVNIGKFARFYGRDFL